MVLHKVHKHKICYLELLLKRVDDDVNTRKFKEFPLVKALPLQAIEGPEGSRKLRLLDFLTTAQYGGRLSA